MEGLVLEPDNCATADAFSPETIFQSVEHFFLSIQSLFNPDQIRLCF